MGTRRRARPRSRTPQSPLEDSSSTDQPVSTVAVASEKQARPVGVVAPPIDKKKNVRFRLCLWLLQLFSLVSFCYTDSAVTSSKDSILFLVLAVLCFAWCGPLTILLGIEENGFGEFKIYQPFRGPEFFTVLQALGWSMYSLGIGFCLVVLLNFNKENVFYPGELSIMGGFGFAANSLLISSLDWFAPPNLASPAQRENRIGIKAVVALIVSSIAFLVLVFGDLFLQNYGNRGQFVLSRCTEIFFVAAVAVHLLCGCVDLNELGYKVFMPFTSSAEFQILQSIGWGFLGLQGYCYVNAEYLQLLTIRGAVALYGAFGIVSIIVLTCSLNYFTQSTPTRSGYISLNSKLYHMSWICQVMALGFAYLPGNDDYWLLSSAFFSMAPPLAHVGGYFLLAHRNYKLFQPMTGQISFILAQSFGWLLYGVFLFRSVLCYVTNNTKQNTLVEPLALLSHALIFGSVSVFKTVDDNYRKQEQPADDVTNGFRLSDLLNALAFGFSLLVEAFHDDTTTIQERLLEISIVVFVLSRVVLYFATFGDKLSSWRPFQGPDMYVMSEAVSWTLFIIALLSGLILLNSFYNNYSPFGWTAAVASGHVFSHLILRSGALLLQRRQGILKRRQSSAAPFPPSRGISRIVSLVVAHLSWFILLYSDYIKNVDTAGSANVFGFGVIGSSCGIGITQLIVGPRSLRKYRAFQPFRGGSEFVLLSAISWTMYAICLTLSLVFFNLGFGHIAITGLLSLTGTGFYCSQMLLIWSLKFFEEEPTERKILMDTRVGFLLAVTALVLFLLVDFCVIRFGLPYDLVKPVISLAYIAACSSVPVSTYVLYQTRSKEGKMTISPKRDQGMEWLAIFLQSFQSPAMIIFGCVVWSFTILLGGLLVANSILTNNYIPVAWAATMAGITNIVSYVFINVAAVGSGKNLLLNIIPTALISSVALGIAIQVFVTFVLPLIRAFLDYPMKLYAYNQKRVEGWISPDGLQALRNVSIRRGVSYGPAKINTMDIMRPLSHDWVHLEPHTKSKKRTPIIYAHGGGHIAVTSEILLHSMTPLCRAGFVVYSADYPLSPEAQYPVAVLSIIRAALWVKRYHCSNLHCQKKCETRISKLYAHECNHQCDGAKLVEDENATQCRHCGEPLGIDSISLCGDSAGASLVTQATALLCNKDLLRRVILRGGPAFKDLLDLDLEKDFPRVSKVVALYGLLGRQTPYDVDAESEQNSFLWNLICHVGITFVFSLYDDPRTGDEKLSSLTDLSEKDLKNYCKETLLICGESDPLLQSNRVCVQMLNRLGHKCTLKVLPGTHAFHGFPANWMKYLGSDWTKNALIATLDILDFLSDREIDQELLKKRQREQEIISDYSPLIIFPLFLFVLPIVLFKFLTSLIPY